MKIFCVINQTWSLSLYDCYSHGRDFSTSKTGKVSAFIQFYIKFYIFVCCLIVPTSVNG